MAADKEKLVPDGRGSNPSRIYAGRPVFRLGVTQIVIGCVVITAQMIILSVYHRFFSVISQGIWCGAAFVVCGIIGVLAGQRRTTCWIRAHLVLCIFACIFAGALISLSALTSVYNYGSPYEYVYGPCKPLDFPDHHHDNHDMMKPPGPPAPPLVEDYWNDYYNGYGSHGSRYPCDDNGHYVLNVPWAIQFAMNLLMGVSGIINGILTVVAATLSCVPLCCDPFKQNEKKHLDVTSQEQDAGPLPVKMAPSDVIIVASEGSSHI